MFEPGIEKGETHVSDQADMFRLCDISYFLRLDDAGGLLLCDIQIKTRQCRKIAAWLKR